MAVRTLKIQENKWYIVHFRNLSYVRVIPKFFDTSEQANWAIKQYLWHDSIFFVAVQGYFVLKYQLEFTWKHYRLTKYKYSLLMDDGSVRKRYRFRLRLKIRRSIRGRKNPIRWVYPPDVITSKQKHAYRLRIGRKRLGMINLSSGRKQVI